MHPVKNLVIMAGGVGRRMGQDKLLLKIGEETFIEYLYRRAREVFDQVYLSIDNSDHAKKIVSLPGLKEIEPAHIVIDAYPRCGPIGGLCSVFDKTELSKFAVVPVDVPKADLNVIRLLLELCHEKPCIFRRDNGYIEPLIGAYDRSCYSNFRGCLDKGKNSIHKALESNGFKTFSAKELINIDPSLEKVDFKGDFFNVNFPDDYKEFIETIKL